MKIESRDDILKAKQRRRIRMGDSDDTQVELADMTYINDKILKAKEDRKMFASDAGATDEHLRKVFEGSGFLKFSKDEFQRPSVRDTRISPAEEKRLLEFASKLTKGDPDLIVEFGDTQFSVYRKEGTNEGKRDLVEFGEYSNKKGKFEGGER